MNNVPWKRLGAEGLIIVISILLAFSIEAWWDDRRDRKQEIDILKAMREDFVVNQQRILGQMADIEAAMNVLGPFVTSNDIESVLARDNFDIRQIVTSMLRTYTTNGLTLGFLESTVNSGLLAQISSSTLRGAFTEIEFQKNNLDFIADDIRFFTDRAMIELGRHPKALVPIWDITANYMDSNDVLLKELHSNSELRALTNAKLQRFRAYTNNLEFILAKLHEVTELIDSEIGMHELDGSRAKASVDDGIL